MGTTVMEKPQTRTAQRARLRPLDPDLPVLAARAAIEVEGFRLGKRQEKSLGAVREMTGLIKNSFAVEPAGSKRLFIDHGTATVIGQSLNWNPKAKSMSDLVKEAWQIVGDLEKLQAQKKSTLERFRDFFVALSKRSAAYREALRGTRAAPPYRR
jgi:hypothetical protein